ncbi:MAG: M1 family metallopeptidase [Candidatus Krumholzibacteriota bacterium]|nr:M1 family metallopeptidase [Candidatus Krumholzibacteriota bacterium]
MKKPVTRISFIILLFILYASALSAQTGSLPGIDRPYWQQRSDYIIKCRLDTERHTLTGTQEIKYKNNSPDTLSEIYLHLYPNAYRERDSELLKDFLAGVWFQFVGLPGKNRGFLDIDTLTIDGRAALFTVDGTILRAGLARPLLPGAEVAMTLAFTEKIRKRLGRAGYVGDHYDMGQWYPKMVVYDNEGWHPDQFRMGEFYGEFGRYDVHITLPERYVVAATGVPVSGDPGWGKNKKGEKSSSDGGRSDKTGEKMKTVVFRAENVHDFAWCADPDYIVESAERDGYSVMSFYRPWNTSWADSALARGVRAVEWLDRFAGPYGYPQISIVDANSSGGMEYPMLVMNGSAREGLIFHELGHSWFYGMLANNERDEAWMDEGLTQYQKFLYNELTYGPYGKPDGKGSFSFLAPRKTLWESLSDEVIGYHRSGFAERVATPHHEFRSSGRTMVYIKSALFIRALRYYVGDEDFWKILHTYFERWKFKHVDEEVFLSICEEISGKDLGEFFRQWLHTTKDCDYAVDRFDVEKSSDDWVADVRVKRKGEMIMPLKLAFRLKNGNTVSEWIDGFPREHEKSFTFPVEPVSLSINPENEILDIYQLDNFSPRRRALVLDNPFSGYYPSDAYQLRLLPLGYYNDIDGGKAGLRIRGSYDGTYRNFTLQGLYGFESETIDFYGAFESPLGYFGREASWSFDAYNREGRQGGSLAIDKIRRKHLSEPLAKQYTVKLTYQEMKDPEYIIPGSYEEGKNLKASLFIASYPRTDILDSSVLLGLERSTWGSEHNYEKLSFDLRIWPSIYWPAPFLPKLRFFYGRATIDPPVQELFNLAGAGSIDKDDYFWLRSRGAFWKDNYGNFHVPGDGNLRGYYNGDFGFKSIFTSNFELEMPLPLPLGPALRKKAGASFCLFHDWGKILGGDRMRSIPDPFASEIGSDLFDGILQDFGVGVKVWKLRAEFPIYLSDPVLAGDEEKWEFRWTIGFNSLF